MNRQDAKIAKFFREKIEFMNEMDRIASEIVDSSLKIHRELGPGLLESAYEVCLAHELSKRGFHVAKQIEQPVRYDGVALDVGYRIDLLVNDLVIVELKAVEQLLPIHQAQLLTYLKLSGKPLGLLIDFNVPLIKDGIRRVANKLIDS